MPAALRGRKRTINKSWLVLDGFGVCFFMCFHVFSRVFQFFFSPVVQDRSRVFFVFSRVVQDFSSRFLKYFFLHGIFFDCFFLGL